MSAFPPSRNGAKLAVTPAIALKYLTSYLTAAESQAHLLPNARLEADGATIGWSSVTMHNLRRVEAGLRGEWMAPSLDMHVRHQQQPTKNTKMWEDVNDWIDLDADQRERSEHSAEFTDDVVDVTGQDGYKCGMSLETGLREIEIDTVAGVERLDKKPSQGSGMTVEEKLARKMEKRERRKITKKTARKSTDA